MEKPNHWVTDWISGRAESPATEENYTRYIQAFSEFCHRRGVAFETVVADWRAAHYSGPGEEQQFLDHWQDLIRGYTTYIKPRYAPLSLKNFLSVPKSFFSFYKIPVDVELPRHSYVLYHNRDLTREQLRQILARASQRDRTIWLLMAESGLRGQTAISLRYWQIKDDFERDIIPMRILTPSETLKDHVGDRWSFIGEDGVKALREYLKPRMPLRDQDFVFASEKPGKVRGEQFSVASISVKFTRICRALNLEKGSGYGKPGHFRMHGLRKYFRNNMKADPAYREFWMGHSLGVDEHYVNRDPEFHRAEYKKGYESLRILETITSAQLKDINDQIRERDQEIQELRKEVGELKQYATALKVMADLMNEDLNPTERIALFIKMLAKAEEAREKEPIQDSRE